MCIRPYHIFRNEQYAEWSWSMQRARSQLKDVEYSWWAIGVHCGKMVGKMQNVI